MNPPQATVEPLTNASGFDLVEEDDVAFSMALCREIDRIYGMYLDGGLAPSDHAWAGLALSATMLARLQQAVASGMPAMRLQVGSSQVQEMIAVLFGGDLQAPEIDLQAPEISVSPDHALESPVDVSTSVPGRSPPIRRAIEIFDRQRLSVQVAVVLIGSVVSAVLIDVPLVVMALFPNLLIPLAATFAGLAVIGARTYRGIWPPAFVDPPMA